MVTSISSNSRVDPVVSDKPSAIAFLDEYVERGMRFSISESLSVAVSAKSADEEPKISVYALSSFARLSRI